MNVFPFKAAWMACTNSSAAECLTTNPEAPGVQRAARVCSVLMHRQENDLDVRVRLPQPSQRLEPVEVWHRDVDDDYVGAQPFCKECGVGGD